MSLRRVVVVLLRLSLYVAAVNAASSFKAEILYPQDVSLTVYQNDAIIVRYNSEIPDNSLYTWCWDGGKAPTLKARIQDAVAYNGEELVTIDYTSSGSCWFNLKSNENPKDGGYNSGGFKVASGKRATASTFSLGASTTSSSTTSSSTTSSSSSQMISSPSTTTASSSESSSTTRSGRTGEITLEGSTGSTSLSESALVTSASASSASATATASGGSKEDLAASGGSSASSGDRLGTAARIGLGVGIAVGVVGIAALAVAFWMVRRRNMAVKRAETDSDSEELQGNMPKHPWRTGAREADLDSEELQGDMPKRPWRTDFREMASNEELRRGPQHELPG